jgi:hypothetical protein
MPLVATGMGVRSIYLSLSLALSSAIENHLHQRQDFSFSYIVEFILYSQGARNVMGHVIKEILPIVYSHCHKSNVDVVIVTNEPVVYAALQVCSPYLPS